MNSAPASHASKLVISPSNRKRKKAPEPIRAMTVKAASHMAGS
jgi:hypothetical protein